MREESLLRLFQFIINYPLYALSFVGFAVMHYRFANRLGCYGFFRNLLYTIACIVVAFALSFLGILLIRYANVSSILCSQLIVGFAFAAIVISVGRTLFRTQPKTPKILSESSESEPVSDQA